MVSFDQGLDDSVVKNRNDEKVTTVEKLESRSWDRDNIENRLSDVQNAVDTIEGILQDINESLDDLPSEEQLKDEWEAFFDRTKTDHNDNPEKYPPAFVDMYRERSRLMTRYAVWEARRREIERFARRKLGGKFGDLLEEYRTARSFEKLESVLDDKAEQYVESKMAEKTSELDSRLEMVKQLIQAQREERKSDRKALKEFASAADGIDEDRIRSIVEDAAENGIEQFITSDGLASLDREELDLDEKMVEREKAAESAASSDAEDIESSGELTAREKLVENWDDYFSMMTQKDIAEELDISQPRVNDLINEEDLKE